MIIWGTRGLTSEVSRNEFFCPRCDSPQTGVVKQVRNFFTLYFIPLIPLNVHSRHVECASCKGTYEERILANSPKREKEVQLIQLLRVMVMAAIADGIVDDNERAEINKQYLEFTGFSLGPGVLDSEIQLAMTSGENLNSYVASITDDLGPQAKALLVKFSFHTMSASGDLKRGHQEQLAKLAETLEIPEEQFMDLIDQLAEME